MLRESYNRKIWFYLARYLPTFLYNIPNTQNLVENVQHYL